MSLPRLFALFSFFLCLASCRSDRNNSQLKEIDNGLRLSIHFIAGQNEVIYHTLDDKQLDPITRYVSSLWAPPAYKVRMSSARAISYIDSLHAKMSTSGSLSKEDEKTLFDTLVNCRRNLLNVFPDSLDPGGHYVAEDRGMFRRHIPLLLDTSGHAQPGLTFPGWADHLFQGDTALIALSLDKLKIDILLSEQAIARYCNNHAESSVDRFTLLRPLITINSSLVAPGDTIELTAGIGAYSNRARPKITIAGAPVRTNSEGAAEYIFRASKRPGRYSIPVTIEFWKPDGQRETVTRVVHYQVKPN